MKIVRCLKKYLFALPLLTLASPTFAAAESPNSIAGWTFDFTVKSGLGLPSSGKLRFYVASSGKFYRVYGLSGYQDSSGPMLYARNNINLGQISFPDNSPAQDYSQVLTFTSSKGGSYVLGNGFSRQTGTFVAYSGVSPTLLGKKLFLLTVQTGSAPFASSGSSRLVTVDQYNYVSEITPGFTNNHGAFYSFKTNRSTTLLNFSGDASWESGFFAFTFATATNGVYLARGNGGQQTGTFVMRDFVPPTFVTQPTSRSVAVGGSTVMSARVNGTGPLFLQWYRNGEPIPNETSTNLHIPFVEQIHGGTYRLQARNTAGTFWSSPATLTAICNFTLETNQMSFPAAGGNESLSVAGTGTCAWNVTNSIGWITITGGATGSGVGSIEFSVAPNTGDFPRFGSLVIGNKTFVVTQLGSVAPTTIAGKSLSMTVTNESGTAAFSSHVLAMISGDAFRLISNAGTSAGTYGLLKTETDKATLTLTNDSTVSTIELFFVTPTRGTYALTQSNSAFTQSGIFELKNSISDFNRDGQTPDLLFQNVNGSLAAWFMRGTNFLKAGLIRNGIRAAAGWRVVGVSDFNNDSHADLLFQHDKGAVAVWYLEGTNYVGSALLRNGIKAPSGSRVIGLADFNNDGGNDLLFQNINGSLMVWYFDGTNYLTSALLRNGLSGGAGWRAAVVNDFNHDGQPDVGWQHTDGRFAVWYLIGGNYVSASVLRSAPGWRLTGVGDFNFDARNDMLFSHANGKQAVWFMDGSQFLGAAYLRNGTPISPTWKIVGPK